MSLNKELSINLGLPRAPLTQNAELFTELSRVYNSIKGLAGALDRYTGVLNDPEEFWPQLGNSRCFAGLNSKIYLEAAEDLEFGNLLSIDANGMAIKAQDGVARCLGFCRATNGTLLGETTEMQLFGIYPAYPEGTLTPGNFYYLSATPGVVGVSASAPAYVQIIGFAISDTTLYFNPKY